MLGRPNRCDATVASNAPARMLFAGTCSSCPRKPCQILKPIPVDGSCRAVRTEHKRNDDTGNAHCETVGGMGSVGPPNPAKTARIYEYCQSTQTPTPRPKCPCRNPPPPRPSKFAMPRLCRSGAPLLRYPSVRSVSTRPHGFADDAPRHIPLSHHQHAFAPLQTPASSPTVSRWGSGHAWANASCPKLGDCLMLPLSSPKSGPWGAVCRAPGCWYNPRYIIKPSPWSCLRHLPCNAASRHCVTGTPEALLSVACVIALGQGGEKSANELSKKCSAKKCKKVQI